MNKASKYRWLQLHLSILILTTMAASGLLWLAARPRRTLEKFDQNGRLFQWTVVRGWPLTCYNDSMVNAAWPVDLKFVEPAETREDHIDAFQFRELAIDVLVNVLFVLIVARASEYFVRRWTRDRVPALRYWPNR